MAKAIKSMNKSVTVKPGRGSKAMATKPTRKKTLKQGGKLEIQESTFIPEEKDGRSPNRIPGPLSTRSSCSYRSTRWSWYAAYEVRWYGQSQQTCFSVSSSKNGWPYR